jgi:hypothetical protein
LPKVISIKFLFSVTTLFWGIVRLIETFDWGKGVSRAVMLIVIMLITPVLMRVAHQPISALSKFLDEWLFWFCVSLLGWHVFSFIQHLISPNLIDIALSTIRAADVLAQGGNPYQRSVDIIGGELWNGIAPNGYKYMPMMAIAYLPFHLLWGERGILVLNFILDLSVAGLVYSLSSRWGGRTVGLFSTFLYLMLPLTLKELYSKGSTDLLTIVPLLGAMMCLGKYPTWAGLGVGLSISCKLFPGALFVVGLLPATRRWSYGMGLILGLTPILIFIILSPMELLVNTVLFPSTRPANSTSWMKDMPLEIRIGARVILASLIIGVAILTWLKPPDMLNRYGLSVLSVIASILSSPTAHRNYQLWWLPFATILVGVATFRLPAITGTSASLKT